MLWKSVACAAFSEYDQPPSMASQELENCSLCSVLRYHQHPIMASKNLDEEPLDLRSCVKEVCYNKYSKHEFLAKEKEIRKATQYENEAPTVLDFILLYIRLIKMKVQQSA